MGIYVNPGNITFRRMINSDVYVDKTNLILVVNQRLHQLNRFLCVSRPRRFGKSMAADMLVAYYSKGCASGELFSGLQIVQEPSYKEHLNQHNVIRFDVQRFLETKEDLDTFIEKVEQRIKGELYKEFSECVEIKAEPDSRLKEVLEQIFVQTGQGFVFVIDEWDCVFRLAKEQKEKQKEYLEFLRGLFKGAEYVDLVYMTGILPIKKYGEHSALNIFDEYSMIDSTGLSTYFGFTEEEVQRLCQQRGVDFTGLQEWYDGYLIDGVHIYNPKSVTDALQRGKLRSYWAGTETYEALKVYLDQNFDGLKQAVTKMLGNTGCRINPERFENDMTTFKTKDDILTLLVHLGYLTYDQDTSEVWIPNKEIAGEFVNAIDGAEWNGVVQALSRSEELLKSTWSLDGEAVADQIAAIHQETASILQYNNENSLTCTILLAYYSAKAYYLNPNLELPTGKGFADVVYLPKRNTNYPALLIELKWNKSAKGAIAQIQERQYTSWIEGYSGEILLVGINYDTETKEHSCVIEQYVRQEVM